MPVLQEWDLTLDVDQVLRGQGADPAALRARSPRLVETAAEALEEGRPLLEPRVLYRLFEVEELRHERLKLRDGGLLSGQLIAQHMGGAKQAAIFLCTIGETLERRASEISSDDLVYGLALDGVGSAAVEVLANATCSLFETRAAAEGMQATIPLSPGMIGWPVEMGQPQIFNLLDPSSLSVRLTESMVMIPRKSITFVLGLGAGLLQGGSPCDYCSLRATCTYQDHYARA